MLPEIGVFALSMAFALACIAALGPVLIRLKVFSYDVLPTFTTIQCLLIFFSFFTLMISFVMNDFTVAYVQRNSHSLLPLFYRWCAVWGAHEGSMLLWLTLLALWMLLFTRARSSRTEKVTHTALVILNALSAGFTCFILATSNPFTRQFIPGLSEGRDLNPLLQDVGFLTHPPMLYMGYVGFAIVFALALAHLIHGQLQRHDLKALRTWTIAAWAFLTLGITLGSWWAYRELGWGGYWFWDPVENASFLPWLTGTALLHCLLVNTRRQAFFGWTILLAILTFSLSLLGTFLVRSGILTSVHAFAVNPGRGYYMLAFLFSVIGGAMTVYALRGDRLPGSAPFTLWSKESLLLANNVLFTAIMLTVLLGTIYPLLMEVFELGKLSVGAPYFNAVVVPLALPMLMLMGFALHCRWQRVEWRELLRILVPMVGLVMVIACVLAWLMRDHFSGLMYIGLLTAVWIVISTLRFLYTRSYSHKATLVMAIAHIGVAMTIAGLSVASHLSDMRIVRITPGESVAVGGYTFRYENTNIQKRANYTAQVASFDVFDKHKHYITTLYPEKRHYLSQRNTMTEAAVAMRWWGDWYVALGEALDDNAWTVRIAYKPMVRFIWLGGLMMFLAGILALIKFPLTSSVQHVESEVTA